MRIWLCGLCVAVALPVSGGDRMAMVVTPAYALAPSPLRVRIRIEPSAENRSLMVSADSVEFYRGSEIPLEGGTRAEDDRPRIPRRAGGRV